MTPVSSDYYGSIAGEQADADAADEAAFLAWLDAYTRKPADGTYHDHLRAAFIAGTVHARNASPGQCCDLHGRNCEPPSELCCWECTEARHGGWTDGHGKWRYGHPAGETCSNPVLPCDRCPNAATCAAGNKCLEPR